MTTAMDKKIDPSHKDCAYCETSGAKLTCAKCKAAHYCSKACQKQHWKNGHKGRCIAPERRRPQAPSMNPIEPTSENEKAKISGECPICFNVLSQGTLCTLPCQHDFHRECVEELREHGVLQACPLCRAALPDGPEKLFEDATRKHAILELKVENGEASWHALTTSEKKMMAEVVEMWTTAANEGHVVAQYNLGVTYDQGQGVSQDFEEAARWFGRAAEQGHPGAQFSLGVMYFEGEGVSQDLEKVSQLHRKAADQGHSKAQFNLSTLYRDGKGVAQDFEEAARWCRKAAAQGYADAQYTLSVFYWDGRGVLQDFKQALQWARKAADQGDNAAQFNLGTMYLDGKAGSQDSEEAARWFRKAAEQGYAAAQINLGLMYDIGEGVSVDLKKAARWYQKAADQGNADAQFILGNTYRDGKGVAQDSEEAVRWYQKAAVQGHADAQHNIMLIPEFSSASKPASGESSTQCASCGRGCRAGVKLKPCSRCKAVFYCGEDCQRKHWRNGHKLSCTPKK